MNAIELIDVTKYYGKFKALDNVNLVIPEGRIIGLLGKNGAGKSTLLRCILGYLKFEGTIRVFDIPVVGNRQNIARRVAFIPDVSSLDDRLTVKQTIEYVSNLHPMWNHYAAETLIKKSELPLNKKVSKLSKGMKTKLYLLVTLALDVDVLILDEPTLGLDISFRKEFFNTILGDFYNENRTIIISTHQVEEVEHILDDLIFIDNGKVIAYESVEKLKSDYKFVSVNKEMEHLLDENNVLLKSQILGKSTGIIKSDIKIDGAEYSTPRLTDIFLALIGGTHENETI